MGNETSLQKLENLETNFNYEEIKRLGKRFKKLDSDKNGSLSLGEFMTLPELQVSVCERNKKSNPKLSSKNLKSLIFHTISSVKANLNQKDFLSMLIIQSFIN